MSFFDVFNLKKFSLRFLLHNLFHSFGSSSAFFITLYIFLLFHFIYLIFFIHSDRKFFVFFDFCHSILSFLDSRQSKARKCPSLLFLRNTSKPLDIFRLRSAENDQDASLLTLFGCYINTGYPAQILNMSTLLYTRLVGLSRGASAILLGHIRLNARRE